MGAADGGRLVSRVMWSRRAGRRWWIRWNSNSTRITSSRASLRRSRPTANAGSPSRAGSSRRLTAHPQSSEYGTLLDECQEVAVMAAFSTIREDIDAVFQHDPAARTTLEVVLAYPGLHAIWIHHGAHWLWQHELKLLG